MFINVQDACCLVWNYRGEIMQQFRGHKVRTVTCIVISLFMCSMVGKITILQKIECVPLDFLKRNVYIH